MELLDGVTLEARLAAEGYLPLRSADSIARQLCAALTSIHQAHVIHRDLKPGNIMLVPHDGAERAMVMDFGLAHAVSAHPATDSTTVAPPGVVMGTPDYIGARAVRGQRGGAADGHLRLRRGALRNANGKTAVCRVQHLWGGCPSGAAAQTSLFDTKRNPRRLGRRDRQVPSI